MRKGRGSSNNKQESAPVFAATSLKKGSSHRKVMEPQGGNITPVTSNHQPLQDRVTTEDGSSERSKSESGWHTFIQKRDWTSLSRYLEQISSPPIPQLPQERHSNMSHNSHRGNSKSTKATPRESNGSENKKIGKRSSSLNWLKRSVASMGNMSARTHAARLCDSHNQEAIEEQEKEEDRSGAEFLHLDKASLLISNANGRTPLQLALNAPEAPDPMILHLLRAQPKAVAISDTKGRLPLHFAVVRKRRMETIAELVELFPDALHRQDQKGKTPVSYAIEVAKRQTNLEFAPGTFWASPPLPEQERAQAAWQKQQHLQWEMARWLLQASACLQRCNSHSQPQQFAAVGFPVAAVDHQHPFFIRNGARSQQHVLIEAMLHAAPPTVVELLVEASSALFTDTRPADDEKEEYQLRIVSMACSAFYLAIFRQYPLPILKRMGSLLQNRKEVKTVRDETGLGLVSAHYVTSCFKKNKLTEYVGEEKFMVTMEECILHSQLPANNIPFLEWWDKLKYLVFFCVDKNPDQMSDDYLLHAALENTDTPPNVIRLLLALYPGSARQPDPQSAHPLHLFAMHRDYIPRNYESPYMHGLNVMDMLLSLDESAVFHNFQRRLPLHHAIASGRTWSTIHPVISSYRSSLRMPDPITKLYPCQLAAAYREDNIEEENTRLLQLTRNQYSAVVWQGLSQKQQRSAVERIRQFESLKRLDTIFELFRRYPQCVETAIQTLPRQGKNKKELVTEKEIAVVRNEESNNDNLKGDNRKERDDSAGPEMITFHYLSWCYKKVSGVWQVVPENMEILQSSIQVATEHRVLSQKSADFVNWWGLIKVLIVRIYNAMDNSDKEPIPKDDNHLLHIAVSIPTTPPDLVELILGLYPKSASLPLPNTTTLPLHLACKTTTYTPQYFEVVERPSTLQLVLQEFPEAIFARSSTGQSPLHIAIQAGKTIDEIRPLIEQGPSVVLCRDPASGLFPFQLMAASKPLSSDLRLRFRTLAANRHSAEWNKFTGQRKMKEIRTVEKEYQMTILDSAFELLRLGPSTIEPPQELAQGDVKSSSLSLLRSSLPGSNSLVIGDSSQPMPAPSKGRKRGIRRNLSGVSRDSSVGGGSAFSTIDMMSTISNVSSHLSFRRASSISDGKLSRDGRLSRQSMLGEEDSESEDSDIWSEDMSFHDDDAKQGAEQEAGKKDARVLTVNQILSEHPRESVRQQKLKSKWEAPAHFAAKDTPVDAAPVDRNSIPQVIVEPADVDDDVSYLDNINPRSRSGRTNNALRRSLMGDSLSSEEETAWADSESRCVAPEDIKVPEEPKFVAGDYLQARRRSTVPIESAHNKKTEEKTTQETTTDALETASDSSAEIRKQSMEPVHAASISIEADEGTDDDSIHDEIVSSAGNTSKGGESAEEPVVVFRIRKTSCQRTGDAPRTKARSESQGNRDMGFLSILNASLPEGKMDFLSALQVSSDNLPPVSYSLPSGLDARGAKLDRMARIQEFPSESDHSAVPDHRLVERAQLGRSIIVPATPNQQSKISLSPPSIRHPDSKKMLGSPGSSAYSASAQSPCRRAPQNSPRKIGVQAAELQSCLKCESRAREVMVLPCSHLCVCRNCAIEEEIRSCPICFGPVTDKKVVFSSATGS